MCKRRANVVPTALGGNVVEVFAADWGLEVRRLGGRGYMLQLGVVGVWGVKG